MPTPYCRESALRLVRQSPQTKRQLATELGISEPSVRKLMHGLEAEGLIKSGLECHSAHYHPTKRVRTYRINAAVPTSIDTEMQRRREAVAEFGALPIVF